jgi:hypothetical protein
MTTNPDDDPNWDFAILIIVAIIAFALLCQMTEDDLRPLPMPVDTSR